MYNYNMSDKLVLIHPENLENQQLIIQEQRRILHNNLMQRILKIRDKLSNTTSLTKINDKLNDLEVEILSGGDLEKIEIELIAIEKTILIYLQSFLQLFAGNKVD